LVINERCSLHIRDVGPGNGTRRDARRGQGLEGPQRGGKLNMVPPLFLTGFKRFALTLPFEYLLCPICHSATMKFLS